MVKLKGSTLIETLMAISVILFCTSLAAMIFSNVLSSQNTAQKTKACYISCQIMEQTKSKRDFLDFSEAHESMKAEKTCKTYKGNKGLIWVNVKIFSEKEKVLWEENQIFNNE